MNKLVTGILAITTVALAAPASAALVSVSKTFDGNDCSGYFGTGFDTCQVWVNDDNEQIKISPVIAKYGFGEELDEINTGLFPSFDGTEIDLSGSGSTGSWSYNPGEGDPGIRYWAAKGGDYFNLFWYVDEADQSACEGDAYNLGCLNAAQVVNEGAWETPEQPGKDKNFGLSHLTFYDSVPPTFVPEPGSLALLGLGLIGLRFARRQSKSA